MKIIDKLSELRLEWMKRADNIHPRGSHESLAAKQSEEETLNRCADDLDDIIAANKSTCKAIDEVIAEAEGLIGTFKWWREDEYNREEPDEGDLSAAIERLRAVQ